MRWSIAGLATACTIALAILAYGRIASTGQDKEQDWRQRELTFLMSVHDRIQAELGQPPGAERLRVEERAILHSMAAVAKPMPADRIPAGVALLLASFEAAKEDAATSPAATAPDVISVGPPAVVAAVAIGEAPVARPPPGSAAPEGAAAFIATSTAAPIAVGGKPASRPSPVEPGNPRCPTQPEDALHAEKTDRGLRITLPAGALFGGAGETIDASAEPSLSRVVELITVMRPREVVVVGHTDASSKPEADLVLSKKRAQVFARALKARGLGDPPHLITVGYGGTRPLAPNENADGSDNPDGRQQNRRIEILLRRH